MEILTHIAAELFNVPLYLDPRKAATIAAVLGSRVGLDGDLSAFARSSGGPLPARAPSPKPDAGYQKIGHGIALVSVVGSLVTRSGGLDAASGLVSYDAIKAAVRMANTDADVTSILLDIHSGGGHARGALECADVVYTVAQQRPVVAVCNSVCCSAAYSIAAAASRIVATKSAMVGSIGVCLLHLDRSKQLANAGLLPTFITAGKHKADANEFQALEPEVKDDLQHEVDAYYEMIISSIAGHRRTVSEASLRATEARTYVGKAAVDAGLVDEIGTIEGAVAQLKKLHAATQPDQQHQMFSKVGKLYGTVDANRDQLNAAHREGLRAGMAAALAGRSDA